MDKTDAVKIRNIARWLKSTSVGSNGDSSTPATQHELKTLRDNVAKAIAALADIVDDQS